MLDTTTEHPYAAGVIRFTPDDGPQWHVNSSHIPRGFDTSIPPEILSNGTLRAQLLTSMPVAYATASGDETFTARRLIAGISGAVSHCNISISSRLFPGRIIQLDDPAEYALVAGEFSNLWLYLQRVPPLT